MHSEACIAMHYCSAVQALTVQTSRRLIVAVQTCSWLSYTEEVASDVPLGGDIVQRLQRFGTYGRLKQIALRKVAHNIDSDSALVSELRAAFRQIDTHGTGEAFCRIQLLTGVVY